MGIGPGSNPRKQPFDERIPVLEDHDPIDMICKLPHRVDGNRIGTDMEM